MVGPATAPRQYQQGNAAHQSLVPVRHGQAVFKRIAPDTTCALGPIAGLEARLDWTIPR